MSCMETLYNGSLAWKRKNASYFVRLLWYSDWDRRAVHQSYHWLWGCFAESCMVSEEQKIFWKNEYITFTTHVKLDGNEAEQWTKCKQFLIYLVTTGADKKKEKLKILLCYVWILYLHLRKIETILATVIQMFYENCSL